MISRRRALGAAALPPLLAACAQLPRTSPDAGEIRTGRLALTVADQPAQSFAGGFELRGRAEAGELALLSPLGGIVALLRWQPGSATFEATGRDPQRYPSLQAMIDHATGTPLPVAALFDWLSGTNTPVPGWEADLSQLADGRIRAMRRDPPPQADLRVVLDR
jgi:outer membrane lipoprotein LolB